MTDRLNVHEMFWSFQGEGARFGLPSIFIRLAGCSMRCPYCDTKDSWGQGTPWKVEKMIARAETYRQQYPHSQVVITGGEPLEQDISGLVDALKKAGFFVTLETNGNWYQGVAIDWWTVSPKDVNDFFIHEGLLTRVNEVKLVVTPALNLEVTRDIHRLISTANKDIPIFLQPDANDADDYKNAFALFKECVAAGIPGVRCGIQIHKVYDIP